MRCTILLFAAFFAACQEAGVTKFNASPDAVITSHVEDDTVREGKTELLVGQVGDVDDEAADLRVTWTVGGADVCEDRTPEPDGTVVCEATFEDVGGTVILTVSDPAGAGASDTVKLNIQPNDAPVSDLTSPTTTGKYYADQTITFQGTVADTEDATEDLTVSMETDELGDLGLELEITSEGDVEAFGLLPEGGHAVRLRVVDTTGKEGIDSTVITVGPANSAPTCAIGAPVDGSAGPEGEEVRFEGSANDVDVSASELSVSWESDKDGPLGESTPDTDGSIGLAMSDLSANTHRITLTVVDELGESCTNSIYYTVGSPPDVNITAPEDEEIVDGSRSMTFSTDVVDEEDLPDEIMLEWAIDGEVFSEEGADFTEGDAFGYEASFSWDPSVWGPGEYTLELTATDTDGLAASDSVNFTINAPPSAPTVTINPDPATTTDNLFAVAEGSEDPDESGSVTYRYAWFADGVEVPEVTGAEFPAESTAKDHTYRVEVFASDGLHESGAGSAERTVSNTAPTITDVSIDPDAASTGTELTCTSTAEDADGDTVDITYVWSDGTEGDTLTIASDAVVGDTLTCTATANDGDTGTDSGTATATVTNTPPVMSEVTLTPETGQVGDTLTCAASATDEDGDDIDYTYAWSTGTEGERYIITEEDNPGDTITCMATATDSTGATATDSASAIVENTNPDIAAVSIVPDTATVGTLLVCSASATDADGAAPDLIYTWSTGATGPTYVVATSDDPGDTLTCTVTATDDHGGSDTAAATALVENTEPTIVSITVLPSSAGVGESLTCTAIASDVDGESPTITYAWFDGVWGSSRVVTSATSPGETLTCTATANDGDGGIVTASASATITNTNPTMGTVSITPTTGKVGDVLTCVATATDLDGGTPTMAYAWSTGSEGSTHTIDTDDAPGETLACTATATDDDGGTATGTATATVENTAPVMGGVTVGPDPAYNDSTLTCSATATDADGETPTITYAWTGGATGPELPLTSIFASPEDVFTCTATATDARDASSSATASITITNRPPTMDEVVITPENPTVSDTLTCSVVGMSDPDDDSVEVYSIVWNVAGHPTMETSDTLEPGPFIKGMLVTCSVGIWDPWSSEWGLGFTRIVNTAPVVSVVSLTPSDLYTNDTLNAVATTTDADDEDLTVTYAFSVNGDVVQDGESASLSGATHFDKGDTVYVLATVDDGDDTDSRASDSITVQNTAPTVPVISMSGGAACDPDYSLEFNGADTHLSAAAPNIAGNDPRTVMAWAYIGEMGSLAQNLVTLGDGWVDHGRFSLFVDPTFNLIIVGEGHDFTTGHYIEARTWTHIAATYDGSTLHVYVNGEPVATTGRSYNTQNEEIIVGRNSLSRDDGEWWDGFISEVKIWERDLSAGEIADEMGQGIQSSTSDLRAYLPLGEGTGSTAYDASGAGRHASISGAVWVEQGPFECDTMICNIDEESTDADGDAISYTFAWDVNGIEYTDTDTTTYDGDTLPSGSLDYSEIWTCEVTPNDGEDDGEIASAEYETEVLGQSCSDLYAMGYEADGNYAIDPDGSGPVEQFEVYCDMSGGQWTLVANIYDSTEDDAPNDPSYVAAGWEQTGAGAWTSPATAIHEDWGTRSSAAASFEAISALSNEAGQSELRICLVHETGANVRCRSTTNGTLTLGSYGTGSAVLTLYSSETLVYTYGRLAGYPGSGDDYSYEAGWHIGKTPDGIDYEFGWAEGFVEYYSPGCPANGVWHASGNGISYRPEKTDDDELGTSMPGCGERLKNPTPNTYGFRLYVSPCESGSTSGC